MHDNGESIEKLVMNLSRIQSRQSSRKSSSFSRNSAKSVYKKNPSILQVNPARTVSGYVRDTLPWLKLPFELLIFAKPAQEQAFGEYRADDALIRLANMLLLFNVVTLLWILRAGLFPGDIDTTRSGYFYNR